MASCRKQSHSPIDGLNDVEVERMHTLSFGGHCCESCVVSMEVVGGRSRREDWKKSESKIIATVCGDGASRKSSMVENVKFMINHVIVSPSILQDEVVCQSYPSLRWRGDLMSRWQSRSPPPQS